MVAVADSKAAGTAGDSKAAVAAAPGGAPGGAAAAAGEDDDKEEKELELKDVVKDLLPLIRFPCSMCAKCCVLR